MVARLSGWLSDHPPMVALFITPAPSSPGDRARVRLMNRLPGHRPVLLARATEDLFPGRRAGTGAALFSATLLAGVGAVAMTPDTPLTPWAATVWALARLHRTGDGRGGAIGALAGALLSKYTAALLGGIVNGCCSTRGAAWRWAGNSGRAGCWPWPSSPRWCCGMPTMAESLRQQGGRAGTARPSAALLSELIGGQVSWRRPWSSSWPSRGRGGGISLVAAARWRRVAAGR